MPRSRRVCWRQTTGTVWPVDRYLAAGAGHSGTAASAAVVGPSTSPTTTMPFRCNSSARYGHLAVSGYLSDRMLWRPKQPLPGPAEASHSRSELVRFSCSGRCKWVGNPCRSLATCFKFRPDASQRLLNGPSTRYCWQVQTARPSGGALAQGPLLLLQTAHWLFGEAAWGSRLKVQGVGGHWLEPAHRNNNDIVCMPMSFLSVNDGWGSSV